MTIMGGTARPGSIAGGRIFAWACAVAASVALLMAPAIWNGFPLLQYDTGGYLARWYEGYLVPSRSTVYGLFLFFLQKPNFWPAVLAQTAVTVWLMAVTLRVYGLGGRPLTLAAMTALLTVGTSLPWLSGILLTDIFAGLSLLAAHILMFQPSRLSRAERYGLIGLIAFSVATHSATYVVLLAVVGAAAVLSVYDRSVLPLRAVGRGLAALVLGAVMLLAANWALSGRVAWTPGGYGIVFARMMQDGIVKRYLDEHCPDPRFRLCAHRNDFPETADAFLWGDSVFNKLGRFAGLDPEMKTIVIESLRAYPGWQISAAIRATLTQLIRVESGEGVINELWHTYGIIERYTPAARADMRAARQQRGEIGFDALNRIHVPVALGSFALIFVLMAAGWRHARHRDLGWLAASATVAIFANAAICAVISNPHARYGARLAWVLTFIILIAAWRMLDPDDAEAG